jgi:hypothetical protein
MPTVMPLSSELIVFQIGQNLFKGIDNAFPFVHTGFPLFDQRPNFLAFRLTRLLKHCFLSAELAQIRIVQVGDRLIRVPRQRSKYLLNS